MTMPSPWGIIGWLIITAFVVRFMLLPIVALVMLLVMNVIHLRLNILTQRVEVAAGQKYYQRSLTDPTKWDTLYIARIHDNGVIGIQTAPPGSNTSHASWGDDPEDWKQRVRNRRLILSDYMPESWT